MPGPAPTRNPRRGQRGRPDWRQLPAGGRTGRVPRWPLPPVEDPRLAPLWRQLWATPQAVAWEELGWIRTVARYAVLVLAAEDEVLNPSGERGPNATLLGEVRQMEDRLGLTPMSMRRLLWEVVEPAQEQEQPAGVTSLESRRAALA